MPQFGETADNYDAAATPKLAGLGLYDRTRPLFDGRVKLQGLSWRFETMSSPEATRRSFGQGEIDAAEVSFGGYLNYLNSGGMDYTAIPAFISRAFRLNSIYIRAGSSHAHPRDLIGKKIGLPDFDHATPIWLRGILAEQYGLHWRDAYWVIGPLEKGGVSGRYPQSGLTAELMAEGKGLWECLVSGEIDAVITTQAPPHRLIGAITRLFKSPIQEEKAGYRESRIFPILHFMAVRRSLAEERPDEIQQLYQAFRMALSLALAELSDARSYLVTLPWLPANLEEAKDDVGSDYWTYGVSDNRESLNAFCRYAFDQGYTRRRFEISDLFPEFLLSS